MLVTPWDGSGSTLTCVRAYAARAYSRVDNQDEEDLLRSVDTKLVTQADLILVVPRCNRLPQSITLSVFTRDNLDGSTHKDRHKENERKKG